jgi:glutathione S-transferase
MSANRQTGFPASDMLCAMLQFAQRTSIDAPYLRLLRKAAQIAGGEAELAAIWGVLPEKLRTWLSGERLLPVDFYMASLEIIQRESRPLGA